MEDVQHQDCSHHLQGRKVKMQNKEMFSISILDKTETPLVPVLSSAAAGLTLHFCIVHNTIQYIIMTFIRQ